MHSSHAVPLQHLRLDGLNADEAEAEAEMSDYCSTGRETESSVTERGYEADTEVTEDNGESLGDGEGGGGPNVLSER